MQAEPGVISHNVSKKRYLESLKMLATFQQKKSRQYTTVILTFLALIIFGVFAIKPTISTIVQLQKQLQDSTMLNQQLEDKIRNLQSLQREYDELKPDLPVVEAAIPPLPEEPTLIAQVQALVKKHNLSITQMQVGKVPYTKEGLTPGTTGSFVLSISVAGVYSDINAFVADAVSFNRLLTLDQITVVRDQQNPNSINAAANLKAYFDQQPL